MPKPKKKAPNKKKDIDQNKQQKEDAEKNALEEEESRKKREKEEAEKQEQEKIKEDQRKIKEGEERKLAIIQMKELDEIGEENKIFLNKVKEEIRKKSKWDRYMCCVGTPNPAIQGEINTYINLQLSSTSEDSGIESVLKECDLNLALIKELENLLDDIPPEEVSEQTIQSYTHKIKNLQDLIQIRLDTATHTTLLQATALQDRETSNLQQKFENDTVCLCLWGNLCKNPRIKSFDFHEKGFTFDIPRMLTLTDCAVRLLFTKFDHYSAYSKSYYARKKVEVPETKVEICEERLPSPLLFPIERCESAESDVVKMTKVKENADVEPNEAEPEEKEEKFSEEQKDELDCLFLSTPVCVEWEDFDEPDDVIDLRAYHTVGGVFHFNLLQMPPQPKVVISWTIRELVDPPEIQHIKYVADDLDDLSAQEKDKRDEKPYIGVTMNVWHLVIKDTYDLSSLYVVCIPRVPSDVFFAEEPQIACWEPEKLQWRTDGFIDHKYDEENGIFHFKTKYFGTMALLQDFHINMPFQAWEIRPHALNKALISVIAAVVELEIEISDNLCCISKPDSPQLQGILNKWVTPKELIKMMRWAGVNIFPAEDSAKYVSIQHKNPIIEDGAYKQMAMTASAVAYTWSKWNVTDEEEEDVDRFVFQAAESFADQPLMEEEWSLFLISKLKATKLKMTEYEEEFNKESAEEATQYYSNIYHMMMQMVSPDCQQRITSSSIHFINIVYQLLSAIKPLTYS